MRGHASTSAGDSGPHVPRGPGAQGHDGGVRRQPGGHRGPGGRRRHLRPRDVRDRGWREHRQPVALRQRSAGAGLLAGRARPAVRPGIARRLRGAAGHRQLLRVLVRAVPDGDTAAGPVLPHRARRGHGGGHRQQRQPDRGGHVRAGGRRELSPGLRPGGPDGGRVWGRGDPADVLPQRPAPHRGPGLRRGDRRGSGQGGGAHGQARGQSRERLQPSCRADRRPEAGMRPALRSVLPGGPGTGAARSRSARTEENAASQSRAG